MQLQYNNFDIKKQSPNYISVLFMDPFSKSKGSEFLLK
jgi:hypothetical protein